MAETPDFEDALKRLEAIVQTLEQGELGLEDALTRFEEGVRLSQRCQQALQAAEVRVSQLTEAAGQPESDSAKPETDHTSETDLDGDIPF